MEYLKIDNLLYEYFIRDEEGNIEGIKRAVEGVNLSVNRGEFISILGRNGSGKSTLAKLINALLVPAEGSVVIDGKDTKDPLNSLMIRMKNGMVFQNPDNQIVAGVVEEDVAFGPENIGVEPIEIRERVDNALKTLEMQEYKRRSPNHLSGGQKQRVAVAGVLAMEPKCIILDEATSMLDPAGRKEVIDTAVELNKNRGITIILITHNMEEVLVSDRIYIMEDGQVKAEGTPKEIFKNKEQIEAYGLKLPPIIQIAHELRSRGIKLSDNILTREELVKELKEIKANGNNS